MDVSEAKRLKGLEDENARLKRLPADAMLDIFALKDLLGKKWGRPPESGKHARLGSQTPSEFAQTFTPQRAKTLRNPQNSAPAPVAKHAQTGKTQTRMLTLPR